MKILLSFLLLLGLSASAFGQAQVPTTVVGNSQLTNALICIPVTTNRTTSPIKLYAVTGQNTSNGVVYVQIHQSTTVPTNNATPIFSYPVPATSANGNGYYYVDFGYYGVNLDSCTVVMSTTSTNLTIGSASATIQAIYKNP